MKAPSPGVKLALGTVQFGLAYGVAGRGEPVPEQEVTAILRRAWQLGIDTLDTAAAYGSIEERLVHLMGDLPFRVISKLPALPAQADEAIAVRLTLRALERSISRLGPRLQGLMFHRAEDLASAHGGAIWAELAPRCAEAGIALGVSCYEPSTLTMLARRFDIRLAQLPGNAFDQRLRRADLPPTLEIHVRSAFLQGLLLMDPNAAVEKIPAARDSLKAWHDWCAGRGLAPAEAALAIVKAWPVSRCVVGVDNLKQLEETAHRWERAEPLEAPDMAVSSPQVIDPRLWPASNKP